MSMKAKATHRGHCQVCNALQKLPSGHLAAHGYTVQSRGWGGWFSGTCHGSHHQPFERDRKLVDLSIMKANEEIVSIKALIVKTQAEPADPAKAWRNHRVKGPYNYTTWAQVQLVATSEKYPGSHPKYIHNGEEHRIHNTFSSLEDCAEQGKNAYIAHLGTRIAQLNHYITSQQERLKLWRRDAPLIPIGKE